MREAAEEKFLTAEEFSELPDENLKQELVSGYVVSEPVPGFRHGLVLMRLGTILSEFVRSRSLGVVPGADSGFILARSPDTVRGPDVSFVTKERFGHVAPGVGGSVTLIRPSRAAPTRRTGRRRG